MLRILILALLTLAAYKVGYLVGHNDGFDLGRMIGKLDAKSNFVHILNGKNVGDE